MDTTAIIGLILTVGGILLTLVFGFMGFLRKIDDIMLPCIFAVVFICVTMTILCLYFPISSKWDSITDLPVSVSVGNLYPVIRKFILDIFLNKITPKSEVTYNIIYLLITYICVGVAAYVAVKFVDEDEIDMILISMYVIILVNFDLLIIGLFYVLRMLLDRYLDLKYTYDIVEFICFDIIISYVMSSFIDLAIERYNDEYDDECYDDECYDDECYDDNINH